MESKKKKEQNKQFYNLIPFLEISQIKEIHINIQLKLCTIIYLCATMFCTCHAVHKHVKNMA
jgi:hypothetical protein